MNAGILYIGVLITAVRQTYNYKKGSDIGSKYTEHTVLIFIFIPFWYRVTPNYGHTRL